MKLADQPWGLVVIWIVLSAEAIVGAITGAWLVSSAAIGTALLTLAPLYLQRLFDVRIPSGFLVAIAAFLLATLFLGEVRDFYNLFWWWDIVLHAGSAVAFGLIGVVLMLMLVKGNRLKAAPGTVAMFAFCFAVTIGVLWEVIEFTMDQTLGTNTQKSGLVDTMTDLIVDCLGAAVGALSGYVYLREDRRWFLSHTLHAFVSGNGRLFRHQASRRK